MTKTPSEIYSGKTPAWPTTDEAQQVPLPIQPIDRLLRPVARILHIEATSGVVLLLCTVVALVAANSPFAETYAAFWHQHVHVQFGGFQFEHTLHHVINDGLMAIFFFVIGLEVKREIAHGSLSDWRQATPPIAAALGGMVVPAGLYLLLQYGQPGMRGWGIPMATDIAFVVGCLALLGHACRTACVCCCCRWRLSMTSARFW